MRALVLAPLILALVIIACSRGDDSESRTLRLPRGDVSEEQLRNELRGFLVQPGAKEFCESLKGLSALDVADALRAYNAQLGITPVQEADRDDQKRAGEIVQQECNRIK
ncbi:MAG TPA: hypothetical protein VNL15_06310 [Dehalococcoidia bacterium]|nr:hypothetical protein [Dehalococcoidia bacterium]